MTLLYSGYEQVFLREGKPFTPKIYPVTFSEEIPEGFNVVSLTIDATAQSSLDWQKVKDLAQHYVEQGLLIFWDIDLGLLNRFSGPLSDEGQFHTLGLGLKHFSTTIWPQFETFTFGALLFKGSLGDLIWTYEEEEEYKKSREENHEGKRHLFIRDSIVNYLKLLCVELPDNLNSFILLDTDCVGSADEYFQLTRLDAFDPFRLILKGKWPRLFPYSIPALAADHGQSPLGCLSRESYPLLPQKKISLAFYLPSGCTHSEFESILPKPIKDFGESSFPLFRILPEKMLTYEWDGIDDLIVFSSQLSMQGKRKLQGFCAAGGRVITIGAQIGLTHETPFETFDFS